MSWKYVQRNDESGQYRTTDEGGGGGSSTFAGLDDVDFSNLQDGQVPKYNSQSQKWENADESGGTVTDVQVDGTSVVNAQGVAEITIPTPPAAPVQDVQVDGVSVVDSQGVADITIPTPDYPVKDVKVNGTSVVDANDEAQIKSYKEVTLAEYQALGDAVNNDDILYCITDMPSNAEGFPPLIYSTEEREVGVWIDGRPLYQKVIKNISLTHNTWTTVFDGSSINARVKYFYGAIGIDGNTTNPYCNSDYNRGTNTEYVCTSFNTSVSIVANVLAPETLIYGIVQYTKTTDTPGSGTWNQQGALAHHYSTSEKIIGTWIDGKPVYEKTIYDETSYSGATTITIGTGILDAEEIIDIKGMVCWGASSNHWLTLIYADDPGKSVTNSLVKFVDFNTSNGNLQVYIAPNYQSSNAIKKLRAIIQYTKTTD